MNLLFLRNNFSADIYTNNLKFPCFFRAMEFADRTRSTYIFVAVSTAAKFFNSSLGKDERKYYPDIILRDI